MPNGDIVPATEDQLKEVIRQIDGINRSLTSLREQVTSQQMSQVVVNEGNSLLRSMVMRHEESLVGKSIGDGIIYRVSEHTKFQSTMEKVLWIIVTPFFALFGVGMLALIYFGFLIANKP